MKAIVKRELKNYLSNPVLWIGIIIVGISMYQMLEPYLGIHYFQSDAEVQEKTIREINDADVMEGYLPSTPEQQLAAGRDIISRSLIEEAQMNEEEVREMMRQTEGMNLEECVQFFEEQGIFGSEYAFEDAKYHQGSAAEVNQYIEEKLKDHPYSAYFARKFADSCSLHMGFFATVLLAFLFLQDTRRNTYELLHTKPLTATQYLCGKIGGGMLIIAAVLAFLNFLFFVLCAVHAREAGFTAEPWSFLIHTALYILPNMLMILCVYTITALGFRTPIPAAPLLIIYIIYSNMGSRGADGKYGYYGRPLGIMVRFTGKFFETGAPPMAVTNQICLLIFSAVLILLAAAIWKKRRIFR